MSLADLSDELLLQIFENVTFNTLADLASTSLTCRKWRRILWSDGFYRRIDSFQYQSRFILYRFPSNKFIKSNPTSAVLQIDQESPRPYLNVAGRRLKLRYDITNCPLINMSVTFWCRTIEHSHPHCVTLFVLWHFHLGYLGLYSTTSTQNALLKSSYTASHENPINFRMEQNQWYHVAMVVDEDRGVEVFLNGLRLQQVPLQKPLNKQNLFTAPHSSLWLASHCGGYPWHGSIDDLCLWNRCLKAYEIKAMAKRRTPMENVNFCAEIIPSSQ